MLKHQRKELFYNSTKLQYIPRRTSTEIFITLINMKNIIPICDLFLCHLRSFPITVT